MATLILAKDCKARSITETKEDHNLIIKGSIYQDYIHQE